MLRITNKADVTIDYPIEQLCNKEKLLFFDIETTGFSRKYNIIYLIGIMYYEGNQLYFTQYLAENHNEEAVILQAFYKKLALYDTIIHFNGNAFDIPFVVARGQHFNMDFNFDRFKTIDLYKLIKPYKQILKLEDLKQKTLEKHLNIKRVDPFSGGDLIAIYEEYVKSKDERLLKAFLLHNMEDVFYMGKICSILSFYDFMNGKFTVKSYSYNDFKDVNNSDCTELVIELLPHTPIPIPISYLNKDFCLVYKENAARLTVKVLRDTCKFFFPNYKDYYYLPNEDRAIHKSIAMTVDRQYRKPASASTCYINVPGDFLPIYDGNIADFGEVLKKNYADKAFYVSTKKITRENILKYIMHILKNGAVAP